MFFLLLWLGFGNTPGYERVPLETNSLQGIFLTVSGELLLATRDSLVHWGHDGRHKLTIELQEGAQIAFPYYDVETRVYWIPYTNPEGRPLTAFYDEHGKLMNESDIWFRYVCYTGGKRLVPEKISDFFYVHKNRYTFQIQEFDFQVEDGMGKLTRTGTEFGKITPKQMRLTFNYKLAWPVANGDGYLLMNELEKRIYLYDRAELEREKLVKENVPREAVFMVPDLPDFVEPPDRIVKLNGTPETAFKDFERWENSFSRVTYFNRYGDGYAVAYVVPECRPPSPHNPDCDKVHTYLVKLDADLKTLGPPTILAKTTVVGTDSEILSITPKFDNGWIELMATRLD